jgi:hypothetical protein
MKQVNQLTESEARKLLRQYREWALKLCNKFPTMVSVNLLEIANLEPLTQESLEE